jgi:hypothetical protein
MTTTIRNLRRAYNTAVETNQETFTIEGNTVLTQYCKYMLEYLDMQGVKDTEKIRLEVNS